MNRDNPTMRTVTVRVPLTFRKRGGAKKVMLPDGTSAAPLTPKPDGTMVKALARAFRWQRKLEDGEFASLAELAAAEKINPSYVSRVVRLTLLAPDIVDAILVGHQSRSLTLACVMRPFPLDWQKQNRGLA